MVGPAFEEGYLFRQSNSFGDRFPEHERGKLGTCRFAMARQFFNNNNNKMTSIYDEYIWSYYMDYKNIILKSLHPA